MFWYNSINTLKEELSNIDTLDKVQQAVLRIEEDGLDAVIYNDKTAREWANILVELARKSLKEEERKYLSNV